MRSSRDLLSSTLILLATTPLSFGQDIDSIVVRGTGANSELIQGETKTISEPILPDGARDTTSLSFRDTDIRDIFRGLSAQHGLNIFLNNEVNKRVSLSLNRVRVHDAITFLCEQNDLVLALEGSIYRIKPPPPPEPPPVRIPLIGYQDGKFFVDLKNDDLDLVIGEIQKKSGKNILLISGTTGSVTGRLTEIDFDIGFSQLMNNNGFAVQKKNDIYVVSRLDHFVGTDGKQTAQKSGPYWVDVKDSLVTIDVTAAPIERVVSDMIRQLNTDVVMFDQPTGNTTVRATNISLPTALDLVFRNSNFTYRESNGIYFVGEKTNKSLISTRLLRLRYLRAEQIVEMIPQAISSQAVIKVSKEHNGFVVNAAHDVIEQMKEFLEQLDRPVAQVLLEAIVVDYDLSKASEFGISAGILGKTDSGVVSRSGTYLPGFDVTWGGNDLNNYLRSAGTVSLFGKVVDLATLGHLPSDFYLSLKAMEQRGLLSVKSRPLIATLNGHKATLSIGTTQYYLLKTTTPYRDQNQVLLQETESFQTIEANVSLEITPFVGSDGLITLDIKPDFKTPVGQLSSAVPPTINSRTLSSTVVVREGETIVLGGLVQESETEVKTRLPIIGPLLGWIPLIGSLFSSTVSSDRKTELLIYVTPHISHGEAFQTTLDLESD